MTLEKIIEQRDLKEFHPIICTKSKLSYGEILTPKYIDVKEYLYDDKSDPELNTWVDVEGIEYGWIWCRNKIRSIFKILQRRELGNLQWTFLTQFQIILQFFVMILME